MEAAGVYVCEPDSGDMQHLASATHCYLGDGYSTG